MRCLLFALSFGFAVVVPASAQTPVVKDPAELFPPDTLLYVELTKPAAISDQVASLVRGSLLDDLPTFMYKWQEKRGDRFFRDAEVFGIFSTFVGPEALAEVKRLQGAAVAITGVNKRAEPEVVGFVLSGESNVPGFIMRAVLSSAPFFRSVGQVEGVTIFREDMFGRLQQGQPLAGAAGEPVPMAAHFAQLPGIVLIGSSKDSVADVIKRIKGKEKRLSLAGTAGFKDGAALRERPGIFFYSNPTRGTEQINVAVRAENNGNEPPAWAVTKELLNPKGMRSLVGSLSLGDGLCEFQLAAKFEPKQTSPLLELFVDQKIDFAALQAVPRDSAMTLHLPLADGEQRWQKLLTAADAVARASGGIGATPSEMVKEIESKLKTSIAKDIAGKITAITLTMPAKQDVPKNGEPMPMVIVTALNEDAAKRLEEIVPAMIGLAIGDTIEPITETINGQKVRSLPASAMPWKAPVHYCRVGNSLVIGQDRKLVAASPGRELKDSLPADPRFAAAMKGHQQTALLGILQWDALLALSLMPPLDPKAKAEESDEVKNLKAFLGIVNKAPPLVISLTRGENETLLRVHQGGLKESAIKLIDAGLEFLLNGGSGGPPPPVEKSIPPTSN